MESELAAADPISAALSSARPEPHPAEQTRAAAQRCLEAARATGDFAGQLGSALALVARDPLNPLPQLIAARLLLEGGDEEAAETALDGLATRFPGSHEAFRLLIRLIAKRRGDKAALAVLARHFPEPPESGQPLLAYAIGLDMAGRSDDAQDAVERYLRDVRIDEWAWLELARMQERQGAMLTALATLQRAREHVSSPRIDSGLARLAAAVDELALHGSPDRAADTDATSVLLAALLEEIAARRRERPPAPRHHLGRTVLIGSSLASGGAERQMKATALGLHTAMSEGRAIAGWDVVGPVSVCVRSLTARTGGDFFLPPLKEAGIEVVEFARFPRFGGSEAASAAAVEAHRLGFLPSAYRETALRLTDYLRWVQPDVVQIWQDGMAGPAGLAALMAGVPRIVFTLRTLAATVRRDRWKPEYDTLFHTLKTIPGVALTTNSAAAAVSYEEWLDLPGGSVDVIHNGMPPPQTEPTNGAAGAWAGFDVATSDADFTLGAVMRFDENKRPLAWVEAAARALRTRPSLRFVLVGDGPLLERTMARAEQLGLAERTLFTRRSNCVGYWLSKMDGLMLLSQFEGLPNALIEAQAAGVPVITTPAGGAVETLDDGVTGFVLPDADNLDIDMAARYIARLAALPEQARAEISAAAAQWARLQFSHETMIERSVEVFMGSDYACLAAE